MTGCPWNESKWPLVTRLLGLPLFDYFVVGQVIPMNPAAAVRGPKYVVTKGKTPVLTAEEAPALLDSIETDTLKGLRDRALIGVMAFTFARVGAVISLKGEDYFRQGKRWWFRLHEKGGKRHEVRCSGATGQKVGVRVQGVL
jgi:integrase